MVFKTDYRISRPVISGLVLILLLALAGMKYERSLASASQATRVEIDVLPGEASKLIDATARSTVPVAILSSVDFDATTVNPASVRLAGAPITKGERAQLSRGILSDLNADGRFDLIVYVSVYSLHLVAGASDALLTAVTFDGKSVSGSQEVLFNPPVIQKQRPPKTAAPSSGTFSNPDAITIVDAAQQPPDPPTPGNALPYPSTISVAGQGAVTNLTVTITNYSHTFPDDVDILLVGPTGATCLLMSDCGGDNVITSINLTLDDSAPSSLPDNSTTNPIATGTYRPTRGTPTFGSCAMPLGDYCVPSNFPSPAPSVPYGTTLSVFNGTNPNGTWKLHVIDDSPGDIGDITSGWTLSFTALPPPCQSGLCVTNVRARQLGDGSNRVEVLYDLNNAPPSGTVVSVLFSDNGGNSYGISPGAAALSGDIGPGITNGSNRRILWSAAQTLPAQTFGNSFRSAVTVGGGASTASSNLFSVDLRTQSQLPIASFSFLPQSPATGQLVQFTDESSGTIVSWAWDFNCDGFTDSTVRNPSRIFTTPGPHQVTLRVNNAYGSSHLTQTTNVGSMSGVPVVTGVRHQYEGVFLQNTAVDNSFDVSVNWSGSPGTVRFSVNGGAPVVTPGTLNGASHTFHMASDFPPRVSPSTVTITPINSLGVTGTAWVEQVYVFPYPTWLQGFGSQLNTVLRTGEVSYELVNFEFPQPHLGDGQNIQLPSIARNLLGSNLGARDLFGFVRGSFTSRGTGSLTIGAQGGLSAKFEGMENSIDFKIAGSGDFDLRSPKGLQVTGASLDVSLNGTVSKEVGIADAIPGLHTLEGQPFIGAPIRFFDERANLLGELGASGGGVWQWKQGSDGRLHFAEGTGTLAFDMKGTLRVKLWEKRLSASAWLSGGGSFGVGVPDPFLRTAEVHLQAGASVNFDFWHVRFCPGATWNLGCTWTPSSGWQCDSGGDTSSECTSNPSGRVLLSLIKPSYDRFGKYSVLKPTPIVKARSSKTPVSVHEFSLINNLYPDASPTLVKAGSGRLLLWTHQDPTLPVQQSTGIAWSFDNGSSWSAQALIADDTRAEFSPIAAVDSTGKIIAAWLRIKDPNFATPIETLNDLPLFYTRLEVVSATFDPTTQTWGPITQLTDDTSMDSDLRIASDASGHLFLTWFSNQNAELISTASSPSTLKYSFWNGSAWSAPDVVGSGLVGVGYHSAAVYGSNAFIVSYRDPDPAVSTDGLLETFVWNGSVWSSSSIFAGGGIENRLPSAAYDAAGLGHVVWVRGSDLVHARLDNPSPEIVRTGSGSMSFYGAQFFTNATGNLTLIWQEIIENGPANIFAMLYDPLSQTWSSDVRLTEDTWEAHDVSGFYNSDGKLNLVYLGTDILRTSQDVIVGNGVPLTVNNIPEEGQTDLRLLEHSLISDLAVVDNDLSISPHHPLPGDTIAAAIQVHNAGDFGVGSFDVNLYAGSPDAGGVLVGTSTVSGPMAAGASRTVTFSFSYPATGGDIVAVVDATNTIAEFSETNNRATVYLTNTAPQIRLLATPTQGAPPLNVVFDASATFDNEGDSMSFSWAFGDGSPAANGSIVSHTFSTIGIYSVTVAVADARGALGTGVVTINVGCPQMTFSPESLPDAVLGAAYNQTVVANGGTPPTTYAVVAGALPPGLSLSSSGEITGVPSSVGTFPFTVTAADTNGCPSEHDYALSAICQYSLSSMSAALPPNGGNGNIDVSCASGCAWNAVSNAAWITVDSGTLGSGNGMVGYSVTANAGPARTGTMTIAGITFTVTQDPGCTFTLDRDHQSFAANGGTGSVNVTASDAGCAWMASTTATFIHITAGSSGSGNGSVQYSVDANAGTTIRTDTITIAGHAFTVYQGINFLDVPEGALFYNEIGKLSARGVTLGCGNGNFCPNDVVTRDQMAAFIMRAKGEFNPPTPASQRFNDVPPSNVFYNFIDRLAELQITLGCSPTMYCPADQVKREQMAAFLIRGLGEFTPPTPGSQRFTDVPPENPFYKFIDRMAVLQITLGCSPTMYCPSDTVTRAQMAAFLVRAFNL